MRALTICQPYAHLIALGEKPIENRDWFTSYRGPLLVHAGLSFSWLEEGDRERYPDMAFGAVVAVAELVACLRLSDGPQGWPSRYQRLYGHEHANGPFCFVLDAVRRLPSPIPCRGAQGFWAPPREVLDRVQEALAAC
jgi:hypothetical protein